MKNNKLEELFNMIMNAMPINNSMKHKKLFYQLFKFIIVGFIATLIDFFVLILLKEIFNVNTIIANTIAFLVSVIYNYFASVMWVFDINNNKNKELNFILFICFSIIGLIFNNLILYLCIDLLKIYYLLGKVIATFIVMIFNFITRKIFLE